MKLRDYFDGAGKYERVRVFANCQTIFNGKKTDISDKEWNIKVNPYMDCEVISMSINDGTTILMI